MSFNTDFQRSFFDTTETSGLVSIGDNTMTFCPMSPFGFTSPYRAVRNVSKRCLESEKDMFLSNDTQTSDSVSRTGCARASCRDGEMVDFPYRVARNASMRLLDSTNELVFVSEPDKA